MYIKKYIIFGAVNTLLAYFYFAIFIFLGFHFAIATLFAGIISVMSGYYLNKNHVFSSKKNSILQYAGLYLVIYALNVYLQATFLNVPGFNNYIAGLFALLICSIISFVTLKKYIFAND